MLLTNIDLGEVQQVLPACPSEKSRIRMIFFITLYRLTQQSMLVVNLTTC